MDVYRYNKIELAPCQKVKSWAKQRERTVFFYLEAPDRMIIDAQFGDGKSLWVSTETKPQSIEENAAIIKVIMDTMEQPNAEWYAADFTDVRAALKIGADRLGKTAKLKICLYEKEYRNLAEEWHAYTPDTPTDLAKELAILCDEINLESNVPKQLQMLEEARQQLAAFPTDVKGWHYQYGKIEAAVQLINRVNYLKVSSNAAVRDLYISTEAIAKRIYNDYQSLSR